MKAYYVYNDKTSDSFIALENFSPSPHERILKEVPHYLFILACKSVNNHGTLLQYIKVLINENRL